MIEKAACVGAEAGEKGHVSAAQRWRQCAAYVGVSVSHPLLCDVARTRRLCKCSRAARRLRILCAQLDVAQGMRDGKRAPPEDKTCVGRVALVVAGCALRLEVSQQGL
jgi:hypothetical protein